MHKMVKLSVFAVVVAILSITIFSSLQKREVAISGKTEMEKVIKDYITNNPEVIINALQTYQRDQQLAQQNRQQEQAGDIITESLSENRKDEHVYGNPDAPITLVEYSDFDCPYCKRFHPSAKSLVDNSNGQVNWIYRHLPLPIHKDARAKALASECAFEQGGNDAFWNFADALFERSISVNQLSELASKQGLDKEQFQSCLNNEKYADRISRDSSEAQSAGLNGTPGNVLFNNGTKEFSVIPGAVPLSTLKQEVNKLSR